MARDAVASLWSPGCASRRYLEAVRIPHVPAYVPHLVNSDVKVVQELLRHANSRITLDLYASGDERKAASAEQTSRARTSKGKGSGLNGPNWTKIGFCRFLASA